MPYPSLWLNCQFLPELSSDPKASLLHSDILVCQHVGPSALWLLPPGETPPYFGSLAVQFMWWMRCQEVFELNDAVAPSRINQHTHLRSPRRERALLTPQCRGHSPSGLWNGWSQDRGTQESTLLEKTWQVNLALVHAWLKSTRFTFSII